MKKIKDNLFGWIILLMVIGGWVYFFVKINASKGTTNNYSYNSYKSSSSSSCKYTDSELIAYAKHSVENKLKNPKSADFSNVDIVKTSDSILVTGKVSATNSFGGVVSNGFIVTFEADGTATGDVTFTD